MQSKTVVRVEAEEPVKRLAVLIDADNAQAAVIDGILEEIARFGEATVRRIYGDFTSPSSSSWKKVLNQYSIKPVQQFAYTTGKNATDSTMIIDAMDLLYTRRFEGFCLVTSDSDFTGLAVRLREEGLAVYGFGEKKTPEAFRNACHKFIFTELLRKETSSNSAKPPEEHINTAKATQVLEPTSPPKSEPIALPIEANEFPKKFVLEALDRSTDDSGWAHLGTFGSYLQKLQPSFDSRLYGYKKLSDLVKGMTDIFEVTQKQVSGSTNKSLYIKAKK